MSTRLKKLNSSYLKRKFSFFSMLVIILLFIYGSLIICSARAEAFVSSLTAVDETPVNGKIPLILIHGIYGKENPEYWDNFINYFNSHDSLTGKYKLYKFEYDSNEEAVPAIALAFKNDIENMADLNTDAGGRRFVILAHSLGGLVARSYMQEHGGNDRVIKLITLATPHHGSPLANDAPRTGDFTNPLVVEALDLIDNSFWCRGDVLYDTICMTGDYVGITEPNRKDMLWDSYNRPTVTAPYNTCPECNPWLQNLNAQSGSYNHKLILYYGYMTRVNSSIYDFLADMGPVALANYLYEHRYDAHVLLAGASIILYNVYLAGDGFVPHDSGAFYEGPGIYETQRRVFPGYDHDQMKDGIEENGTIPLFDAIKNDLVIIANRPRNDFNHDGISDILWRITSTGQNVLWFMKPDGARLGAYKVILTSDSFVTAGTGDFNGDGIWDILWHKASTGQTMLWFMKADGTRLGSYITLMTSKSFAVAGTGDFNGDGICDILWYNATTGQTMLWLMNPDGTRLGSYKILMTSKSFSVAGTGDFNGDGIYDILWRNASTGQTMLWFMKADGSRLGSYKLLLTNTSIEVACIGDFNGDGISDILWRITPTGQNILWFMQAAGLQLGDFKLVMTSNSFKAAGTGDFNGDGISDILWHNASTGQTMLWFMRSDGTRLGNYKMLLVNKNFVVVP